VVGALALGQRDGARQHAAIAGADALRELADFGGEGGWGHGPANRPDGAWVAGSLCIKMVQS
jgi:hypothetical protein